MKRQIEWVKTVLFLTVLVAGVPCMAAEQIHVGRFQSRALLNKSAGASESKRAPAIILIPGAGEFGPEEFLPFEHPPKGTSGYAALSAFASSFQAEGFYTLQLGKPGIEFFKDWETVIDHKNYYDKDLWNRLKWEDLVTNVEDAIAYLKKDPKVDPQRIYLLGHSEGTVVASDVAAADPSIAGVILLGYAGEPIVSVLQWQVIDRQLNDVIRADIDANHDGFITYTEASQWPDSSLFPPTFLKEHKSWDWSKHPRLSIDEISKMWQTDPELKESADINFWIRRFPFWKQFAKRSDIVKTTASIKGSIHVFTGEYDVNTPPEWSRSLKDECQKQGKPCAVEILPGLTHKFTPVNPKPAGPHFNKVLDQGDEPISKDFLAKLKRLAGQLNRQKF